MKPTLKLCLVLVGSLLLACQPPSRSRGGGDGGTSSNCTNPNCHTCNSGGACLDCPNPGKNTCSGGAVFACNNDGTFGPQIKQCANGEKCNGSDDCINACEAAAGSRSYIGCDYWPVTTMSGQINPYFDFAVAVANPAVTGDALEGPAANIKVYRGTSTTPIKTVSVASGEVQTITLPWVTELSQNENATSDAILGPAEKSILSKGGAYHLVSDLPVTVYQFSPLQFEKAVKDPSCIDAAYAFCVNNADCDSGGTCEYDVGYDDYVCQDRKNCHSYTNDASILLPTATLKNEYVVISRQTFAINGSGSIPGFFAVVGTDTGTTVTVDYSAYTESGTGVTAASPGTKATYTLNKGDVLQVASKKAVSPCALTSSDTQGTTTTTYCDLGPKYDLTGTHISSDKPVAVFGGHSCSFVPYNKWACDHLEEQMTPLDTWGQKVIVAQTEQQISGEPNVFRIVSGSEANTITFDPATVHAPVTLGKFQYVEFTTTGAFLASGTGRIAVAQFMVGQNYLGYTMNQTATIGDPAFGLGVNVEQMRDSYDFLTPATYTKSYVNIVGPTDSKLTLDNKAVSGSLTTIGTSGYGYQRIELQPGAHHVSSNNKFAITVNGVAPYTAYFYVGGQGFNDIPVQ